MISDAVLLKRGKHLESKGESSFAEQEIEEEQSDKKFDKIAKAVLIAIPIITILFFSVVFMYLHLTPLFLPMIR